MKRKLRFALMVIAGALSYGAMPDSTWADSNPWAGEVSEARSVRSKTEDIAERLAEKFAFSPATHPAMSLDQLASQLESSLKCGASWQQIQSLLHQTCHLSKQVHQLVHADCNARADRRLMGYFPELEKRLAELDHELMERIQKLSVPVCAPKPPVRILPPNASGGYGHDPFGPTHHGDVRSYSPERRPLQAPSHGGGWNNPWNTGAPREQSQGYPEYLEALPPSFSNELNQPGYGVYEQSPALPPGSNIGPIRYRPVDQNGALIQPIGQSRYGDPGRSQPIGRQVLSTVLQEIANRL